MGNSSKEYENNDPFLRNIQESLSIIRRNMNYIFSRIILIEFFNYLSNKLNLEAKNMEDKKVSDTKSIEDIKDGYIYIDYYSHEPFTNLNIPVFDSDTHIRDKNDPIKPGDVRRSFTRKDVDGKMIPVEIIESKDLLKVHKDSRNLEHSYTNLRNDYMDLQKSHKELKTSHEDLKNSHESLSNQVSELKDMVFKLISTVNSQAQEIKELKEKNTGLENLLKYSENEIAILNGVISDKDREIVRIKKENIGLKDEREDVTRKLKTAENTITALKDNKKTLVKNLRESNKNNENLERENKMLIMAQNPSLSKESYEFYEGFELVLMSELPKDEIPIKGKMYIGKRHDKLEYVVLTHTGEIANGIIVLKVTPELTKVIPELTKNILSIFREQILEIASKRNHVPPLHYTMNTKHSPSREYNIVTGIRDTFSICMPVNSISIERKEEEIRRCAYTNDIDGLRRALEDNKNLVNGRGMPDSFYSFSNKLNDKTALMLAAQEGHIECVKLLLKSDSNPNLWDRNKYTALDYAQQNRHAEIENILIRHGAAGAVRIPTLNQDNRVALQLK
jgi:predicted  nucleic acid-binding Zn-ribbon protein